MYRITWPRGVGDPEMAETWDEVEHLVDGFAAEAVDENEQALTEGAGFHALDADGNQTVSDEDAGRAREREIERFRRPITGKAPLWTTLVLREYRSERDCSWFTVTIREA